MRIYTFAPLAVLAEGDEDYNFFCRDMGLTCHGLQAVGVDSKVVLLDFPNAKKHKDLIRANLHQLEVTSFWNNMMLNAVVVGTGAAPRYEKMVRAIKVSGSKAILRCDAGTAFSQWQKTIARAVYENYLGPRYREKSWLYAAIYSLLKTLYFYLPAAYDNKIVRYLSQFDVVLNETPEGVLLLKDLLSRHGLTQTASRVIHSPHPVTDEAYYNRNQRKEKRIIAVGRWNHYSKNARLLIQSLIRVLSARTEYDAHIFGSGDNALRGLLSEAKQPLKRRIHVHGKIENRQLMDEYRKSQIMFIPSRSEGSSIAAAEALACGCSVVGSRNLLCMKYFVSKNSGTLAKEYTTKGMSEALECEMQAWSLGMRNPIISSMAWRNDVSLSAVVNTILSVVNPSAG